MERNDCVVSFCEAARQAFVMGNDRLAATKYLEAFQACSDRWDSRYRWKCFRLFTAFLQGHASEASLEGDIALLKAVMEDKKELKLFRIEAAWTAGALLNDIGFRRDEGADCLREAIRLAEKVPKQEMRHRVEVLHVNSDGKQVGLDLRRMEEIISPIVDRCKKCLEGATSGIFGKNGSLQELLRSNGMILESFSSDIMGYDCSLTPAEFDRLRTVGGEQCDCCGLSREEAGRTLLDVCSGCKKAYYCGRECQVKQWKAGHKKCCRKPGEFKPGDYISLDGLHFETGFCELLGQVVGKNPNAKGIWEVKKSGGTTIPVASEKMLQLRPLK